MFVLRFSILTTLSCFATLTRCQYQQPPPQQAAILSDARYLAGDGTFGAAYSQEDGVEFKEESDVNGDRRGSYSYVDPTGQRRTVTYTAGKNGFQATGDHIPVPPRQVAPQPEYVPLPQYNPPDYQPPPTYKVPSPTYEERTESQFRPRPAYQPQLRPQPQIQPQYRYRPESRYEPTPQFHSPAPPFDSPAHYQPSVRPPQQYNAITTPEPRRFYPPGKLNFNRTPDGFSYTFSKS